MYHRLRCTLVKELVNLVTVARVDPPVCFQQGCLRSLSLLSQRSSPVVASEHLDRFLYPPESSLGTSYQTGRQQSVSPGSRGVKPKPQHSQASLH